MRTIGRTGLVAFGILAAACQAARAQGPPASVPTEIQINAKVLGPRTIRVVTPEGYATSNARYPVVVMLDANDPPMFQLAATAAWYINRNEAGVPPVILVGVVNGTDRIHDMTPPATGSSVAEFPNAGGADAFADFIIDEVLGVIRKQYRTLPTTVLIGHSAGGLFALHVAAHRPGTFQGIIVMSPAIWYNDSTPARVYADKIAQSPVPLRLFAASGGLEPGIDVVTRRFASRLDSIKPARVAFAYQGYSDDSHSMTPTYGIAAGLRFVFDPVIARHLPASRLREGDDSAAVVRALLASESQYAEAARALLMPEELPALAANRVGSFALRTLKNLALATWVFSRNLGNHPQSLGARDGLADVLLMQGDTAAALAHLRKADEIARSTGGTLPEQLRKKLALLEGKGR